MAKDKGSGTYAIGITMEVEAESEDAAIDAAHEAWPGLMDLVGNGRSGGAIVGTDCPELSIDAGDDAPEFTLARLAK